MNKLPAKQIYLLTIIIVGIIALSVYSTYALFTFESSTSDVVSIHTPKSLQISENIYEYQQLSIEPNSVTTTDIYIYNTFEYDVCYSIWYKVIGDTDAESKVQIFENSDELITSSGTLTQLENIKVTIAIINDNDTEIKVNIGTTGEKNETGSCKLNLSSDKKMISSSYNGFENLNNKLLETKDETKQEESSYLTYQNIDEIITYKDDEKIYISEKYTYDEEIFTLENPEELTIDELIEKKYLDNKTIYFCREGKQCSILYKINKIEKQESDDEAKDIYYNITNYDKLLGYSSGTTGLRQVNSQDYVFYGDNPDNFVYYNCQNSNDISTCELWRIIGLFYNKETDEYNAKIIRNDSIGKYQFDSNNNEEILWTTSSLHKYLNEDYKLINNYDIYIEQYQQKIETLLSLDTTIKNQEQTTDSKINILSLSDYLNASSCQKNKVNEYNDTCLKNNWLNNLEIESEWTLTTKEQILVEETNNNLESAEEDDKLTVEDEIIINYAYSIGNNISESNISNYLDVRPVVYLKSRMIIVEGNGTLESPYIIK